MGGGSSKTTVNYLISLIDRVHKIYEDTIWTDKVDGQGFSGMGFIIKKIVVHRKPTGMYIFHHGTEILKKSMAKNPNGNQFSNRKMINLM